MSIRIYVLVALGMLPLGIQAKTWTEECPQMEISRSPFEYGRIWSADKEWAKKPVPTNQVILMSCGNWKVMGREMVCYFGGYQTTYDYWVKKDIPEGVTCERSEQCQFKCTSATESQQQQSPRIRTPRKVIPE